MGLSAFWFGVYRAWGGAVSENLRALTAGEGRESGFIRLPLRLPIRTPI